MAALLAKRKSDPVLFQSILDDRNRGKERPEDREVLARQHRYHYDVQNHHDTGVCSAIAHANAVRANVPYDRMTALQERGPARAFRSHYQSNGRKLDMRCYGNLITPQGVDDFDNQLELNGRGDYTMYADDTWDDFLIMWDGDRRKQILTITPWDTESGQWLRNKDSDECYPGHAIYCEDGVLYDPNRKNPIDLIALDDTEQYPTPFWNIHKGDDIGCRFRTVAEDPTTPWPTGGYSDKEKEGYGCRHVGKCHYKK